MGEGAGSNVFPAIDGTYGNVGDGGDKILKAGPSAWESAQTNLVRWWWDRRDILPLIYSFHPKYQFLCDMKSISGTIQ